MTHYEFIFLDTSFIIAFFNKKDKNYQKSRKIVRETAKIYPKTVFLLSDYIFDELVMLLKIKHEPMTKIQQFGDLILSSKLWRVIHTDEENFKQTWKMMKTYDDKDWSFTDVSSFALMEQFRIKHFLSYDGHFNQYPNISEWIINEVDK